MSEGRPDFYSFTPIEDVALDGATAREAALKMRDNGATWWRFTIVNEEYPNTPYPHGLYVEGWIERPAEEQPFDFPLAAAEA